MPCPFTFEQLSNQFPAEDRILFFKSVGWDSLIDDTNYENTCAMRVSVCLVRLGMTFPTGEIKILKGPHMGKRVKIRWDGLEGVLQSAWGAATGVTPTTAEASKGHQGVVVFERLPGGYPGHIDVLDGPSKDCLWASYFGSTYLRVWPAKK